MKLLFVLALVAVAAARRHHIARIVPRSHPMNEELMSSFSDGIQVPTFKPNHEFVFLYDGQVLTGIPQSSRQHSGTRIQCLCRVQILPNNVARMQLSEIQFAELFNRPVSTPRAMVPLDMCDQVEVRPELLEQLKLPVQFEYTEGMISQLRFDSEDQPWSTNIKRGVLNLLQVRLNNVEVPRKTEIREMETNDRLQPLREGFDFFTVEEETMEGLCNTSYTMVRSPCRWCSHETPVWNVTKSINFENCRFRPEIRYNFRFAEPCPSCDEKKLSDKEKFLDSSTIYRYNITGSTPESFVIESACAEGQYIFTPYNEQSNVIVTYTNQTIRLLGSFETSKKIPAPSSPETDGLSTSLIYYLKYDIQKENFLRKSEDEFLQEDNPYLANVDQKELVLSVLRTLIKQMVNKGHSHIRPEAPKQLVRLVKVLRLVKKNIILEVFEELLTMPELKQTIGVDMLVDCLGLCGSKTCQSTLLELIQEEKVNIIKGSLAIKGLIQSRTVSKPMIDELKVFCESEICKENGICWQSCLLTTGSMIGAMCQRSQDQLATEFSEEYLKQRSSELTKLKKMKPLCDRSIRVGYKNWLMGLLEQQTSTYQKVLVLKVIANCGLPEFIRPLEKIIINNDNVHKRVIRTQAIEALRHLDRRAPKSIQRVLMPVYLNPREIPELRMIALHQILQTQPQRAVLDQIARNLVQEQSRHVAGFTLTYLRSLANSTNPCEKRMADDLKLSLRHANAVPQTMLPFLSRYHHLDAYCHKYRTGLGLDLGVMKSNMSYTPHDVAMSVHGTAWGFWRKYIMTIGIVQHDLDRVIWNLMGIDREALTEQIKDLRNVLKRTPSTKKYAKHLQDIFKQLKIEPRSDLEGLDVIDPLGYIYFRWLNQDYFMLPLSHETIMEAYENLPDAITKQLISIAKAGNMPKTLKQLRRLLVGGYEFNYNTGAMIRELTRKIPTPVGMPIVFSLKVPTIVSIKRGQIKPVISKKKLSLELMGQPSVASSVIINMETWCPVVNTGVRAIAQLLAHIPIDVKVEVDLKGQVPLKTTVNLPTNKYRRVLLNLRSTPATFTRVWPLEKESEERNRWVEAVYKTILGEEWNRRQRINYTIGREVLGVELRVRGQYHKTPKVSLPGTPGCLLSGPNHIYVTLRTGVESPKVVELRLTANLNQILKGKLSGAKILQKILKNQDTEFFEAEEFETEGSEEIEGSEETETKPWKRNGSKHLLKLDIVARGSRKRQVTCQIDSRCVPSPVRIGGRNCLTTLMLKRTGVPEYDVKPKKDVNLIVRTLIQYPGTPITLRELTNDKRVSMAMSVVYGPKGEETKLAAIKILGERSVEQQNLLEDSLYYRNYRRESLRNNFRSVFSPISQYDHLVKASTLTQFKVTAKCDVPKVLNVCPYCLNVTSKAYNFLKYLTYWNSEVNPLVEPRPTGTVRALVKLDPRSYQLVNLTIQTPNENTNITDIPLPYPVYPLNLREPGLNLLPTSFSNEMKPTCTVSSTRVKTFDLAQCGVHIGCTSFSVVSMDCSNKEQPRYAVKMRKLEDSKAEKIIQINTDVNDEIIMKPKKCKKCVNGIEIKLNGEVVYSDSTTIRKTMGCQISRDTTSDNHVIVELPLAGVTVTFDGLTVKIQLSTAYSGIQCGVCGNFNGEPNDDCQVMANGVVTNSRADVFKSFQLPHEESDSCPATNQVDFSDESLYKADRYEWETDMDLSTVDQEAEIDDDITERRTLEEPQKETHVVEVMREGHHLFCFSTEPRPYCPDSMIISKHKKITTTYKCISSTAERAHELLDQARRHTKIDMDLVDEIVSESELDSELLEPVETENQLFPTSCKSFY